MIISDQIVYFYYFQTTVIKSLFMNIGAHIQSFVVQEYA